MTTQKIPTPSELAMTRGQTAAAKAIELKAKLVEALGRGELRIDVEPGYVDSFVLNLLSKDFNESEWHVVDLGFGIQLRPFR